MRILIALPLLLAACASQAEVTANVCAPRLTHTPLIVGDGTRDRAFYGGVSLADVDGDGDLDLMATGGYAPSVQPFRYRANTLYINDGAGHFTHSPDPEFLVADNPNSGSSWADIDDDGDLDAFISTQHQKPDVFLRNLGGGRFAREALGDATATAGSNFAGSWVDMDGDGDYDLMSGGPTLEMNAPLLVYRNDGGNFIRVRNVTIENGASNVGAILWADFDNDGDSDLFAANSDILRRSNIAPAERESPQYYRNDGDWSFVRTEGQGFDAIEFNATAAATADIDSDGDLDLYFANYQGASFIFLNDGRGRFTRDARFISPSHEGWATGAVFADLDFDGDSDLVAAGYEWAPRIWVNDGTGAFTLDQSLSAHVSTYSGGATGDIDGDGDIDVVLGDWGNPSEGQYPAILRNDSTPCGRSLRIALRSQAGAPDPIGARVTLITRGPNGERRQLREASGQSTFRGQSGDPFLFGVPRGERVAAVEIRWPNGAVQRVTRLRPGQANIFTQP